MFAIVSKQSFPAKGIPKQSLGMRQKLVSYFRPSVLTLHRPDLQGFKNLEGLQL